MSDQVSAITRTLRGSRFGMSAHEIGRALKVSPFQVQDQLVQMEYSGAVCKRMVGYEVVWMLSDRPVVTSSHVVVPSGKPRNPSTVPASFKPAPRGKSKAPAEKPAVATQFSASLPMPRQSRMSGKLSLQVADDEPILLGFNDVDALKGFLNELTRK